MAFSRYSEPVQVRWGNPGASSKKLPNCPLRPTWNTGWQGGWYQSGLGYESLSNGGATVTVGNTRYMNDQCISPFPAINMGIQYRWKSMALQLEHRQCNDICIFFFFSLSFFFSKHKTY